ncbi:hypothetical protein ACN6K9_001496 [Streptomyces sp. SAS_267]|uniref:hypothetical protein n=1 Tax=unclassified Streptomyces TaxID=2593676 RepID=UPI0037006935
MARASSWPWSSATMAKAISIPEVTPAQVHTCPVLMKVGSGSTTTRGYREASRPAVSQWVVAGRPSSSPA